MSMVRLSTSPAGFPSCACFLLQTGVCFLVVLGTLELLAEAIESLEIGFDGTELAQAHGLLDQLCAKVAVADGIFDRGQGWDLDAATSMTAWLRSHAGMTSGDAAAAVRLAKRLGSLPVTRAAFLDGTLSSGQVKAIVANVSERTVEAFTQDEAELVPSLAACPTAEVALAIRQWKDLVEEDLDDHDEVESSLHLSTLLEGRWRLDTEPWGPGWRGGVQRPAPGHQR